MTFLFLLEHFFLIFQSSFLFSKFSFVITPYLCSMVAIAFLFFLKILIIPLKVSSPWKAFVMSKLCCFVGCFNFSCCRLFLAMWPSLTVCRPWRAGRKAADGNFWALSLTWGAMAGLFSWGTSDVILFKSFFLGRSCSPEKRLPVSWLGRVKACMASFLKAGGGEDWGLHIWFACASLTLLFSVWHPCLWLYLVFPSPDTPHLPLSLNSE